MKEMDYLNVKFVTMHVPIKNRHNNMLIHFMMEKNCLIVKSATIIFLK